MTETVLRLLKAVPRQLLPLVPMAMMSVVACLLAGLALGVVHENSANGQVAVHVTQNQAAPAAR